jgi:site-specific DNA recombinase
MVLAGTPGTGSGAGGGADVLAAWAASLVSRREGMPGRGYLRFVFYGRVSTEDWQDPVTSRARQLQQAALLVAGQGTIVAEFFDCGQSRTLAWLRRPQAAALVAALVDPDRRCDAVVIGEYERAFYGSQYASMAPLFEHYGIGLWMPEVGGRVTGMPRTTSRPCWLWACPRSGNRPDPDPGQDRDGRADP